VTEFTIGAPVSCADGPCGKLSRLIVEPDSQTVTHLVVEPSHRGPGRLVPVGLADAAGAGGAAGAAGGEISLRCSRDEFGKLDAAEQEQLLPADGGYPIYHPDVRVLGGRMALGMANLRLRDGNRVGTEDVIPPGEVDVYRGEPVYATDGEIGRIQGLVVDPGSQHVSHVLLEEGHLWGHKEVAIPIRAVTRVGDIIRLTISKQQVQDLPPADIEHLPG
jgi:sporulation protein YlmC with PRC-barrel domain